MKSAKLGSASMKKLTQSIISQKVVNGCVSTKNIFLPVVKCTVEKKNKKPKKKVPTVVGIDLTKLLV